jgi:Fic family protein
LVEYVSLMEPMLPECNNKALEDLVFDLVQKTSALESLMHPILQQSIGHLVRSINCYYSNLIEGHDTHPWSIEQALTKQYSNESKERDLQLEAVAHIAVQQMIDEGKAPNVYPTSKEYFVWLHREFCERLPESMLWVENPETHKKVQVIPGEIRNETVCVGQHIPPLPENIALFLHRFERAYDSHSLSKLQRVAAVSAAHHRFLWIHPFNDGNGRVARLMSYAMLKEEGVGSPLWSIARGLARNVQDYKRLLMGADSPREGELDGRGSLSLRRLTEFSLFFLATCCDQVDYMASLFQPNELSRRIKLYVDDEVAANRLPKGSYPILREILLSGEIARKQVQELTAYKERAARKVIAELLTKGLLVSPSPKGALRIGFPSRVVERYFPTLFPGK